MEFGHIGQRFGSLVWHSEKVQESSAHPVFVDNIDQQECLCL